MKKFWNWKVKAATETAPEERTLFLNGTIAEDSWYDDDVTPALFKDELMAGKGNITVWINSPGGDCVAAAQIYNMLMDYPHDVTVKIDGIAASAASVIAMAGTKVLMSPVSTMMIHNPATIAWGDAGEMERAIAMLETVKDSIINAYEIKSGLSRAKLSCPCTMPRTPMRPSSAWRITRRCRKRWRGGQPSTTRPPTARSSIHSLR